MPEGDHKGSGLSASGVGKPSGFIHDALCIVYSCLVSSARKLWSRQDETNGL